MKKLSMALVAVILFTSIFSYATFAATTTLVKTNENYVNVRTGPGTTYTSIGKANTGNTFAYLGSAKDSANTTWYKIQYSSSKVGYIVSTYTSLVTSTTTTPTAPTYAGKLTVTAEPTLNVRASATTSSTILGRLSFGAVVNYYSLSNGWYKIDYNGKVAYISAAYAKVSSSTPAPAPTPTPTPTPSPSTIGTLVTTATPTLNVRAAASTSSTILGRLAFGTKVSYYSLSGGWYKINYNGRVAYISAAYAKVTTTAPAPTPTPTPTPSPSTIGTLVTTATPTLNVRSAASTSSTILGRLAFGTKVKYYSLASGWYKIDYNGKVAYISAAYANVVTTAPAPTPTPTPSTIGTLVTTATPTLNVRAAASTSSTILGRLAFGTKVNYYSLASGWYKIDYNGKVAYISSDYANIVSTAPAPTPTPTPTPTVENPIGILRIDAEPRMNVRSSASTSSTILGTLNFGTQVPYYQTLSGWYKILFNGKPGYVSSIYAKPIPKSATLVISPVQPSYLIGVPFTLTAGSNGTNSPEYRISMYNGSSWQVLKDFSTVRTVSHTPNAAGARQFKVEVREFGKVTAQHTISTSFVYGNVSSVSLTTSPTITYIKQPVALKATAVATGQTLYQFSIIKDGKETVIRDFAVHAQHNWTPTVAGPYKVKVTAKNNLNPSGNVVTAVKDLNIVIPKVTAVTLENKTYYNQRANTIRLGSTGSPTPVYDVTVVAPSGAQISLTNGFKTNEELIWTPSETGTHRIIVSSRDENGTVVDIKKEFTANVVVPVASGAKLTLYPTTGQFKLQEPVTFQASATGSPDLQYRFIVKDVNGQTVHSQPYSADSYLLWTTTSPGNYTVQVDIKDAYSAKDVETTSTVAFTIQNVQGSAHYYTIQYVAITLDQAVAEQNVVVGTTARSSTYDPVQKKWVRATDAQIREEMDPTKILQFEYRKTAESLGSVQVTINGLNVRLQPSTASTSTVLGMVNKGETFQVLDISNGWYQIHYDGKLGWVSGTYVNFNAQAPKFYPVGTLIQVNTDYLRIRSTASTAGTILGQAMKGENYVVLEDSGTGWYKIKRDTITGWISGYYVSNNVRTNTNADITRAIPQQMFQFLDLRNHSGISTADLNKILVGKGILEGQGQAFLDGSVANNVNEIYLVSHAILETGNGKSSLAMGYYYRPASTGVTESYMKIEDPNAATPAGYVKVYNMYGIGAYDADPVGGGVRTAYKNGWTTPALAIQGGAVWVSKNYVNNTQYNQFTLYKMRWNHEYISHQYATDIGWARKQTASMHSMYSLVSNYSFRFVIPQYQ